MRQTLNKFLTSLTACLILLATLGVSPSFSQNHIKDLDSLRNSMAAIGNKMPDMIKASKNNEMRTLERVYEINTYALTTIEAYFKMIKVAVSSDGKINTSIIDVFNGWLKFISKFCKKDAAYLDEAILEMKDAGIITILKLTKNNIQDLDKIATQAIIENNGLLEKK